MTIISASVDVIRIGADENGNTVGKLSLIPMNVPTASMAPMYNEFGPSRFELGGLPESFVNGINRGDVLSITLSLLS